MNWKYQDKMTQDMLDVLLDEQFIIEEYEMCWNKMIQASDASRVSLPATSVSGQPVLHGARNIVGNIESYWHNRMNAISDFLPHDYERHGKIDGEWKRT